MKKIKSFLAITLIILSMIVLVSCDGEVKVSVENSQVSVRVFQSGKSDCIFISVEGYNILIDCADEGQFSLIDTGLKEMGVEELDLLVITHFDNDHIGSASQVIENYPVKEAVMPSYVRHSKPMRNLLEALEEHSEIKITKLSQKNRIIPLAGGYTVEVNAPKKDYGVEDNPNSLITVLTLKTGERLLFAADATKERLGEFFEEDSGSFIFAKMPHHGGYNASVKQLLTTKELLYAAVTVGTLEDADTKMLTLAKKTSIKTLYTCDGDIFLLYKDGDFEYYQK